MRIGYVGELKIGDWSAEFTKESAQKFRVDIYRNSVQERVDCYMARTFHAAITRAHPVIELNREKWEQQKRSKLHKHIGFLKIEAAYSIELWRNDENDIPQYRVAMTTNLPNNRYICREFPWRSNLSKVVDDMVTHAPHAFFGDVGIFCGLYRGTASWAGGSVYHLSIRQCDDQTLVLGRKHAQTCLLVTCIRKVLSHAQLLYEENRGE